MLKINNFDKIIAANWKLNGSFEFISKYLENLDNNNLNPRICGIICPPSVYFEKFSLKIKPLYLGSQDCSKYEKGSYTGEISSSMLSDLDCQFCIIGHSERRQCFDETNLDIRMKAENLMKFDINPIICVGETLEEKKLGKTKEVLYEQISNSLPLNSSNHHLIVAYEPIWAIGSGLTPSLQEINDMHFFLKKEINGFQNFKILYGGSVKSNNAKEIMDLKNVDGVLVGGASLDGKEFIKILNYDNQS